MGNFELYGDGFSLLKELDNNSVQLILTDPPYAETGNKWDKWLDFQTFFWECERVLKPEGALVMTATTRLASKLIPMAEHLYKYDLVWVKDNGTNIVAANHQPIRTHEMILVFGKQAVTYTPRNKYMKYNPQKTLGKAYTQVSGRQSDNWKSGIVEGFETVNSGDRHPTTVNKWVRDRGLHPTQKPLEMFEWLVKTYSDEGDLVVDPFAGSGTTLLAAQNLKRNFKGAEKLEKYREIINKRLIHNGKIK